MEFLLIDNGKMSKSLGNVYKLDDLIKRGIEPLAYRFFTYTSHYRNKLNFTWDAIKAAQISLDRLRELTLSHKGVDTKIDKQKLEDFENRFKNALNDDLNMPASLAVAFEVAKEHEKSNDYYLLLKKFDTVLSLNIDLKKQEEKIKIPEEIKNILQERKEARDKKDFKTSDILRDKLKSLGYIVIDSKEGQKIEKI